GCAAGRPAYFSQPKIASHKQLTDRIVVSHHNSAWAKGEIHRSLNLAPEAAAQTILGRLKQAVEYTAELFYPSPHVTEPFEMSLI
ncbi:MAG: hypothetical protein V7727_21380, partial [Sneathiella sp.]